MEERNRKGILNYLRREDVQERIRQNIQRGRSKMTVTIGRAADSFQFSENQFRDWEERGLLTPQRSTKQRQYALPELDKLDIIPELINAKYSPSGIPQDIDSIWYSITPLDDQIGWTAQKPAVSEVETKFLQLNAHMGRSRKELFLRYYSSQVLRFSLILICDELPMSCHPQEC